LLVAFALALASACLHAGWNTIAHRRLSGSSLVLRLPLVVAVFGLIPVALAEIGDRLIDGPIVLLLVATGLGQAFYYVGIRHAYASNEFSLVYPVSRAIPVLMLAIFDASRAHTVTPVTGAGMALVGLGCLLAPLASLADFRLRTYATRTTLWVFVIALGAVTSTIADKLAMERLPQRLGVVARYSVWEATAALPFLWPATREPLSLRGPGMGWVVLSAAFSIGSYALVLVAYQYTAHTSIVAAIRQLSIPIGVGLASLLGGEKPGRMRWIAAGVIACGVACVVAGA